MRIGLLSDTHGFLDKTISSHFAECDEIWHAGDVGSMAALQQLRDEKPVRAVYGNIDGPELRAELPRDLDLICEGLRVCMTHIGGYPGRYDRSARELLRRRPGLFICGHSHVLRVMRDPTHELLYMNPGAAGHQGWHKMRTVLRFSIHAGRVGDVEAIQLGVRGTSSRGQRPAET